MSTSVLNAGCITARLSLFTFKGTLSEMNYLAHLLNQEAQKAADRKAFAHMCHFDADLLTLLKARPPRPERVQVTVFSCSGPLYCKPR